MNDRKANGSAKNLWQRIGDMHWKNFRLRSSLFWLVTISALCPRYVAAQQATATVAEPKMYVGEPLDVRVVVTGFLADSEPVCEYAGPSVDALTLNDGGVSRQQSQFIHTVDGKITRSVEYRYVYSFQVVARSAGTYEIGPFKVSQGTVIAETKKLTIECVPVEENEDLFVDVELDRATVYVGEHVPMRLVWGFAGDLNQLDNISLQCPLFDDFRFEDPAPARNAISLRIPGKQGTVEIAGTVQRLERNNRRMQSVVSERTMIPDKPGEFTIAPATLSARRVERSRRSAFDSIFQDSFGRGNTSSDRPIRAQAAPLTIQVKPIPDQGRPSSFAGAVGEAFEIDVTTNRSVVRVGDPINLTVILKGGGSLSSAGLPVLSHGAGLSPDDFNVADELPAGTWNAETHEKQFSVSIRVLKESVHEIPSLEYAWFNPLEEKFQTASSHAIALQVLPSQNVSARDAISSAEQPTASLSPPSPLNLSKDESSNDLESHLKVRDLALVSNVDLLLKPNGVWNRRLLCFGWMAAGSVLGTAIWIRYRQGTAAARQRRQRLQALRQEWQSMVATAPTSASVGRLAGLLRSARSDLPIDEASDIDQQIEQLELIAYAPPGPRRR